VKYNGQNDSTQRFFAFFLCPFVGFSTLRRQNVAKAGAEAVQAQVYQAVKQPRHSVSIPTDNGRLKRPAKRLVTVGCKRGDGRL
jgi:hypothetical protein